MKQLAIRLGWQTTPAKSLVMSSVFCPLTMSEVSGDFPANKLFALLRESRWLLLVAVALYIALVL